MVERERRVVVGVSQSLAGLAAVRCAVAEARRRDAPLYAVRAWALPSHWRGLAVDAWQHELCEASRHYVAEAFEAAIGGPPDLDTFVAAPNGRADEVLTEAADREDDLLVLGARDGWLRRWPGWIARGCLRAARCPVIIVPPPSLARAAGPLARLRLLRAADRFAAEGTESLRRSSAS